MLTKTKKEVVLILFLIIFPTLILAEESYNFKQNQKAILEIPIFDNNLTQCSACSCVISINYPNGTSMIRNNHTTMKNNYATFIITARNLSEIGTYSVDLHCNDTIDNGVATFTFEVSPTGKKFTTSQGILQIIFVVSMIFIFLIVFYGAVRLPFHNIRNSEDEIISVNDLKFAKLFLICMSYVMFLFIVALLRGLAFNYVYDVHIDKFFNWVYWIMLSFMYPIIVCSLIFAFIMFINDKKLQKALERGLPFR